MTTDRLVRVVSLALVVAPVGCSAEIGPSSNDGQSASVQQPLSAVETHSLVCSDSEGCTLKIALSPASWTCFVSGVQGGLTAGAGPSFEEDQARIKIVRIITPLGTPGYHELRLRPIPTQSIKASATCVQTTSNRVFADWVAAAPSTAILGGTSQRRCFLTGLQSHFGFVYWSDAVETWKSAASNTWYLGGSFVNPDSQVSVSAVCIDALNVVAKERSTGGAAPFSEELAESVSVTETACGLTKLGDSFISSSIDSGIVAFFNARADAWAWTLSERKSGGVRCIR